VLPSKSSVIALLALFAGSAAAARRQQLHNHLPRGVGESRVIERMSRSSVLHLAIGLPLRNKEGLEALLAQLYNPASDSYHAYLTQEQFSDHFGPSEEDYRAVIDFAEANGLVVSAKYANRMIVDVSGGVAEVEKAFHVKMQTRWHATRGSFFAPDAEPSLDLDVPVLDVSGLDNFELPRPMGLQSSPLAQDQPLVTGSGPGGLFIGKDFRAAYAPGLRLREPGKQSGCSNSMAFTRVMSQRILSRRACPLFLSKQCWSTGSAALQEAETSRSRWIL